MSKYNREYQEPKYKKKHKPSQPPDDDVYYDYSDTTTYREYHEIPKRKTKTFSDYDEIPKDTSFKKHNEIPKDRSSAFKNRYENPKYEREHINKYNETYYSDSEYEKQYDDYSRSDDDDEDYEYYDPTRYKTNQLRNKYSQREVYQRKPLEMENTRSETGTVYEDDSDYSMWETPRERGESLPRGSRGHKASRNRRSRDVTDTEKSHYQSDFSVCSVRQRKSHTPYRYTRIERKLSDESDDETANDTEGQRTSATTLPQSRYQVYATHAMPKESAFNREKLISVVDYNEPVIPVKQKSINTNKTDRNDSGYVYIPVIVSETPRPKTNINSSELKLEKPKEEEKTQNNVEVEIFAAANLEQKNIFDQAQNTPNEKQKDQSPTTPKKKSKYSIATKKMSGKKNKSDVNENDYPVKKPYINVVPADKKSNSKNKPSESKDTKAPIKSSKKKKQSKENVNKKSDKNQDGSTGPIMPNDNQNQPKTPPRKSGILKEQTRSEEDIKKASMKSHQTQKENRTGQNETPTTVIYDQKSRGGDKPHASTGRNQNAEVKKKQNDVTPERKCDVSRQTSSSEKLHKSTARPASKKDDVPEHSDQPKKSKPLTKKGKDTKSQSQSAGSRSVASNQSGERVKLWGYDATPLVYAFQTAQFFLGMTIHDKLMEIVDQYYTD